MSAIGSGVDVKEREKRALELIEENNGMYQSEFWKAMDVSSRTGSRIITSLEEKGLVEREDAVHEGRKTYEITMVRDAKDLDFSLLMAGDLFTPFVSDDVVDPEAPELTQWIMELSADHEETQRRGRR